MDIDKFDMVLIGVVLLMVFVFLYRVGYDQGIEYGFRMEYGFRVETEVSPEVCSIAPDGRFSFYDYITDEVKETNFYCFEKVRE